MQNGPIPTTLTLLSELRKFPPGSKVRFLGCVTKYSTKTAVLTLEHNHPPGNMLQAQVDVNLLVTTMKSHETQIGEWVNVMGYVTPQQSNTQAGQERLTVNIQAIVLWSSASFNLQAYEKSLDHRSNGEADENNEGE
ncbi:uncharacterized protein PAC_09653 [Phialocephala subalpina]|uniref:Single-stranded DNA binding protein 12k chain n=1 Tax=Phialocephala subalpina TaxID=576137 RepID=A0A1L7X407_9HELO|nr:uncharacterized protein PAC_09653 [Phialocephala subalpina]